MRSTVSLLGMYTTDNTIFDHFSVPPEIDRQLVIDNLLMETAELEILYPSPSFLKIAIQRWSQKELPIWQELYDTTTYVYNPIHNYDRTEDGWDDRVPNLTYGKGTGDHSTTRGTDTTTASQRAFNDGSGLVDVDKQILLSMLKIFKFKTVGDEKLLKITIPEDLNYNEAFDAILKTYLKSYELVEIKTTGMGSLFRLSYKVELLVKDSEKQLIDEIRIKNSNLEISLLPYVESNKSL